jgi:hypothetical protein
MDVEKCAPTFGRGFLFLGRPAFPSARRFLPSQSSTFIPDFVAPPSWRQFEERQEGSRLEAGATKARCRAEARRYIQTS